MGREVKRALPVLALLGFAWLMGTPAHAQVPAPIDPALFGFPGSFEQPASAASAGVAFADHWLGDEPFSNPAAPHAQLVMVSPTLMRVNRQDLRAGNRNYDEKAAFFDAAGATLGLPATPFWLYVYQPVLRFENFAFNRGTGQDPSVPPAVIKGQADMRETRAGLAGALKLRGVRLGAALEWSRRQDRYETLEQSGDPNQGTRLVDFDGDAVGGTAGFRYDSADSGAGRWSVGGALRYVPELKLEGAQQLDLLTGFSDTMVAATREAGWEGGLSARYAFTPAFRVMVSMGGRSEQSWEGFGIKSGTGVLWGLGLDLHDARDPWTLRFGLGQEQQDGVPETRASAVGLGLGYDMDGILFDIGLLHRSLDRSGRPKSYDDRVVGSVRVGF